MDLKYLMSTKHVREYFRMLVIDELIPIQIIQV